MGAPRITYLFIYHHEEQIIRNPSRRRKKLIHHFSRCDPQKAIRGNIFHRLLLLYRTRGQLPMTVPQKEEAENFESEPWQTSKFTYWKVCFRRAVTTGSTHSRFSSDWFAEVELATGLKIWTIQYSSSTNTRWNSRLSIQRLPRGIMKMIPTEFKGEINFLEETKVQCLYG